MTNEKIQLVSDAEITNERIQLVSDADIQKWNDDNLGFKKYQRILSGIVRGTNGPFTVSVQGDWGSGKTSLLKLVKEDLDKDTSKDEIIITVWFNAWQYEKEEHIVFPFLATIFDKIHQKNTSKLEPVLDSMRGILAGISFDFGVVKFDSKTALEAEKELNTKRIDTILEKHSNYKTVFESLVVPNGYKIVVLIDDLDRCDPEKAVNILESIKLVLNQPGFIFLLGLSDKILKGYLKKVYTKKFGVKEDEMQDHNYLDKIIQLPFSIPCHTKRIEEFIEKLIENNQYLKNALKYHDIQSIIELVGIASKDNPRKIKQLLNGIITNIALIAEIKQKQKEEKKKKDITIPVPEIEYILIWFILEHSFPEAYKLLNLNLDNEKSKKNIEEIKKISKKPYDELAKNFEKLPPGLIKIFKNKIGENWLNNETKRSYAFYFYGETDNALIEKAYYYHNKGLRKKFSTQNKIFQI